MRRTRSSTSSVVARPGKNTRKSAGDGKESPSSSPSRLRKRREPPRRAVYQASSADESSASQIEMALTVASKPTTHRGRPRLSSIERKQRLDELRIKPDPEGFWDELKQPPGSNPIFIKLEDEDIPVTILRGSPPVVESPVQRSQDSTSQESPSQEAITTERRSSRYYSRLLWFLAVCILGIAVWAGWTNLQPDDLPFRYVAWSVDSNIDHVENLMNEMMPIHQLPNVPFYEMQIETFADEIERLGQDLEIAEQLRDLVRFLSRFRDSVRKLDLDAGRAFRLVSKELFRARQLLQQLKPTSQLSGHICRSEKTLCQDLRTTINRIHTNRVPKDLEAVFVSFLSAQSDLNRFSAMASDIKSGLSTNPELAVKLGIVPPQREAGIQSLAVWGEVQDLRAEWEQDTPIQRRLTRAKRTVAVLQNVETLSTAFEKASSALARYRQSLPRYKDLNNYQSEDMTDNKSIEEHLMNIDEKAPMLKALLDEFERTSEVYS